MCQRGTLSPSAASNNWKNLHFLNSVHFLLLLHETEKMFFHDSILCGYGLANPEVLTRPPISNITCRMRYTLAKIMEISHESKKFGRCSYERNHPTSLRGREGQRVFFTSN